MISKNGNTFLAILISCCGILHNMSGEGWYIKSLFSWDRPNYSPNPLRRTHKKRKMLLPWKWKCHPIEHRALVLQMILAVQLPIKPWKTTGKGRGVGRYWRQHLRISRPIWYIGGEIVIDWIKKPNPNNIPLLLSLIIWQGRSLISCSGTLDTKYQENMVLL